MSLHITTKRYYHGMVGHEYDEVMLIYDTSSGKLSIVHVGTFVDEGVLSTVNPQARGRT